MPGTVFTPKNWFERLTGPATNHDETSSDWRGWLVFFFGLGVVARVIRYYLCFPLWDDESFLCVNFIHRNFAELMQPLDYHQVAPILFLWIERASVLTLGFSEYSLRLVPFVCSIVGLFLFVRVARQLLNGPAVMFAVAIFSVSYPGIRYAAEAKPYCTDMFVPLVMMSLVLRWQRTRGVRELLLLTLLTPFGLGVSYPAVFAAGGFSLVVGGILLAQNGSTREWLIWSGWNVAILMSFAFWFLVIGQTQSSAEGEFMGEYWKLNFPPVSQPAQLPLWILKTHASDFLAYPVGGPNWASSATLLLCIAGIWHLIQRRQFVTLGLFFAPASLHFLAAALQKYPYGGHVKFSQYLAPMICCVAAIGMAQLINRLNNRRFAVGHGMAIAATLLLLVGGGSVVRDLACPYKTRSDFRARAFAQSFWSGTQYSEEVVCLKSDLGLDLIPDQHRELSWSAQYLCNRAIEVSRLSLRPADVERVSTTRPLRCVFYRDSRYRLDQESLDAWLAMMRQYYDIVAHESIPFPRLGKNDRKLLAMEYIDSYRFVPKPDFVTGRPPLADSRRTTIR